MNSANEIKVTIFTVLCKIFRAEAVVDYFAWLKTVQTGKKSQSMCQRVHGR